jgi:osmotically-inducible protein OsmY
MRSDSDIKQDVEYELKWEPDIDASDIGVAVKEGVVTLSGFVRSYGQKYTAERAAKRVRGVLGVANSIVVRLPSSSERPDPELARAAVAAIKSELPYSHEKIRTVVKSGWVTLEGEVEWDYQRRRAENAVRRLTGVKGIHRVRAFLGRTARGGGSGLAGTGRHQGRQSDHHRSVTPPLTPPDRHAAGRAGAGIRPCRRVLLASVPAG